MSSPFSRFRLSATVLVAALFVPGTSGLAQKKTSSSTTYPHAIVRASAQSIDIIAATHGFKVLNGPHARPHEAFLLEGPAGMSPRTMISSLATDPLVKGVEVDASLSVAESALAINLSQSTVEILDSLGDTAIVPYFGSTAWNAYVNQHASNWLHVSLAHSSFATGAGIVAVIDTGIDPSHPLLRDRLVPGYDFLRDTSGTASEWADVSQSTVEILDQSTVEILDTQSMTVVSPSAAAITDASTQQKLDVSTLPRFFGHGTMVAGLVRLMAPTAQIMPLKAFRGDGTAQLFDILEAIYFAVDHGARVINMSFSMQTGSKELGRAIGYANGRGVVCLGSAGNQGLRTLVYPAGLNEVLGIGSISLTTLDRSGFSNYGDELVSVGAPGEALITTYPGGHYAAVWGTSFSTALVAGVAALMVQIDTLLTESRAADSLSQADKSGQIEGMGAGRLSLLQALQHRFDIVRNGGL